MIGKEKSAGIDKDYAEISYLSSGIDRQQVTTPASKCILSRQSNMSQQQQLDIIEFERLASRGCTREHHDFVNSGHVTSNTQDSVFIPQSTSKRTNLATGPDSHGAFSESFRVSSATALNVTRSMNMTKVSPRLHNIQNDVKPQGTKI